MNILGIETSCDETSVAIYNGEKLLAHSIYSQIDLNAKHGGVVPELASRDHIRRITPLIDDTLTQAKLSKKDIHGVAYTSGPGLVGALLVGAVVGRSLAWALNVPAIGVHHLEAHLLAVMLEENHPQFPFLVLLVSGGHTQIIHAKSFGNYEILGESLDDAAGEAFDKTARILNLGYPGGPALAKLAEQGDSKRFQFPRPMTNRPGLDFSFSGLKTAALNTLHDNEDNHQTHADIARAFQDAVVDTLYIKCRRAIQETGLNQLVVAGGVGANVALRAQLNKLAASLNGKVYFPRPEFCTDNAAMVAYVGYQRLMRNQTDDLAIKAVARWNLSEL